MSTSVDSANSILGLIYRAAAWADMAENDGSSPATSLDIALHTAAPATSSQSSNEATYTSYARVSVARSGVGLDGVKQLVSVNGGISCYGPEDSEVVLWQLVRAER